MNGAQFQRAVTLAFSKDTLWPQIAARTAVFAREYRDDKIGAGQFSSVYDTFVNGREGALEETLQPGGVIHYRGMLLGPAVALAIEELRKRAPKRTGAYASSFHVSIGGRDAGGYPFSAERFDPDRISADATDAYVFAASDFSRLLDVQIAGSRRIRVRVPPGFFADAAAAVRRLFPTLHAQRLNTLRWPGARKTREGRAIEYPAVWISLRG